MFVKNIRRIEYRRLQPKLVEPKFFLSKLVHDMDEWQPHELYDIGITKRFSGSMDFRLGELGKDII